VALLATVPVIVVVRPESPFRSIADIIAAARARGAGISYASFGIATPPHLIGERIGLEAGRRMTHVPYRGGAAMVPDLLSGGVDAGFVELPSALPMHRDNTARIVAVATPERSSHIPGVQTFIEAGLPGFTAGSYGGLLAPAATPPDVVATLQVAFLATLAEAEVQSRIIEVGAVLSSAAQRTPEGFAEFLAVELVNARRAAALAGLRPA
jgi:tripartite-type tricarboxylate transporter receptor subunit TctC